MSFDVLSARVVFRDRPLLDVFDLSLRFVVVHAGAYAKLALVTVAPAAALSIAAGAAWGWAGAWGAALALGLVAEAPFTVLASRLVFEDGVRVRDVVRAAAGDALRVVALRVLWVLALAIALSVFFVPAAWVASVFFFSSEAVLLERATVGQAIGRSQRLASSSVGDALFGACAVGVLALAGALLGDVAGRALLGDLLQFTPPAPVWTDGWSALALLGWFAVVPYATTARFFTYLNVRTRVEGWDIQTRFAAIAARADRAKEAA